jgi:hypothetical protein
MLALVLRQKMLRLSLRNRRVVSEAKKTKVCRTASTQAFVVHYLMVSK